MDEPVGIITGGLKGIGEAAAVEFARLGARLVLADADDVGAENVVGRVAAAGGAALFERVDVRDAEAQRALAVRAFERFGRIDFVFANAGIAVQGQVAGGDPDRWRAVVETNLLGAMYSCRAVLPFMVGQGSGHILLTSSVSGREAYAGEAVYIASKWGLVGFAHALRLELLDAGVRVTVLEPGLVDTPLTRGNPTVRPLLDAIDPLAPADVARAAVFAFQQPAHVVLSEIVVRPQRQRLPEL